MKRLTNPILWLFILGSFAGIPLVAAENIPHQITPNSSDISFNLVLPKDPALLTLNLLRGPYLQAATPNSIVIRWRTDIATSSRVTFGTSSTALTQQVQNNNLETEHQVKITGLTPHTKYYYSIGTITEVLQGDANNYFYTLPVAGNTDSLLRIGVIGDCGNNSTNQRDVRDQLINYLGNNYMNAWILLGDNAYSTGQDAEYQSGFFGIYNDKFLKQNPLFPAPGNHDYGIAGSITNHSQAPYYQNFTMPVNGESGGVASNNKAFYSFDIGNTHFLALDSYGKESDATRMYDTTGIQVQWIKHDLEKNRNKGWVVAYWHHPPYTMGSHNSDNEDELVKIRQHFIRILERYGVDLILCGHSHCYERSKLMKGHYGDEASFSASAHNLSTSSALYDGSSNSCPYIKDTLTGYQGTIYVVSGSAGQLGGEQGAWPHNAMYFSDASHGGSMILEIKGNRLDAKWIGADAIIRDHFTVMKDVNKKKTYNISAGDAVLLTASYIGTYTWEGITGNTQSVSVSPTQTTTYVVKDAYNCVRDSFVVTVSEGPFDIKVAPNPTYNNTMNIYLAYQQEVQAQVTVTDMNGRVVLSKQMVLNNMPQPFLPPVRSGTYTLLVQYRDQRFLQKLIIH